MAFPMVAGHKFGVLLKLIPLGPVDTFGSMLMIMPFYFEGVVFLFLDKKIPARLTSYLELYMEKLSSLVSPGKV